MFTSQDEYRSTRKWEYATIFILMIAAAITRMYRIQRRVIWLDEGYSIRVAKNQDIIDAILTTAHPPLYFLIVKAKLYVFGEQEILLRACTVVFGVISVILMYKLGRYIFGRQAALFASVMLIFSQSHVRYSQEIRMYGVYFFAVVLSYLSFAKVISKNGDKWTKAVYVLSTVCMAYLHYYASFVILSQLLSVAIIRRRMILENVKVVISILLSCIPLLFFLKGATGRVESGFVSEGFSEGILSPVRLSNGLISSTRLAFLLYVLILIAVIGTIYSRREKGNTFMVCNKEFSGKWSYDIWKLVKYSWVSHVSIWGLVIFTFPFVVDEFTRVPTKSRYLISGLVPIYLLSGLGLFVLSEKLSEYVQCGNLITACFSLLAITIISASVLSGYYTRIPIEDYREAATIVEKKYTESDLLLFYSDSLREPFCWYAECDRMKVKYAEAGWKHTGGFYDGHSYLEGHLRKGFGEGRIPSTFRKYNGVWYVSSHSSESYLRSVISIFESSRDWSVFELADGNVKVYFFDYKND